MLRRLDVESDKMIWVFLALVGLAPTIFCFYRYQIAHSRYLELTNYGIPDSLRLHPKRVGPPPSALPYIGWYVVGWIFLFADTGFVAKAYTSQFWSGWLQ